LLQALERIKQQVQEGANYEAQQAYKSTFFRMRTRKQYNEAYAILKVLPCSCLCLRGLHSLVAVHTSDLPDLYHRRVLSSSFPAARLPVEWSWASCLYRCASV
jgi:hypothetical protein